MGEAARSVDVPRRAPAAGALDELCAPLGAARFLHEYFDRKLLHLRAGGARAAPLLTTARLAEALRQGEAARSQLITFPTAEVAAAPDPVGAYLDAGYPVICEGARGVSTEIDRLVAGLGEELGAHVWANVYSTGTAGAPLAMHFDAHDVLVVQCEGEKDWRLSRLRANAPVEVEDFVPIVQKAVEETREAAMAAIETTFTAEPGDVVYIPRGQFHAATTPRGRSLHVSFAIRPLCGYDLARALARLALFDPEFRRYPPELRGEAAGPADSGFFEGLRARLQKLADDPRLEQVLADLRAELVLRSRGGRP